MREDEIAAWEAEKAAVEAKAEPLATKLIKLDRDLARQVCEYLDEGEYYLFVALGRGLGFDEPDIKRKWSGGCGKREPLDDPIEEALANGGNAVAAAILVRKKREAAASAEAMKAQHAAMDAPSLAGNDPGPFPECLKRTA